MRKHIIVFLSTVLLTLIVPAHVFASTPSARPSAKLITLEKKEVDNRAKLLRSFLEKYDSSLASYADDFVEEADKNSIDWKLLPAIAGVESGFGKHIPQNSHNGWGWGIYGGNVHAFTSWEDGIETISRELRIRYMDRWGAKNVFEIGRFYAADPNWAHKVTFYMNQIETFENKQANSLLSISI